jgi:hypothetical protein
VTLLGDRGVKDESLAPSPSLPCRLAHSLPLLPTSLSRRSAVSSSEIQRATYRLHAVQLLKSPSSLTQRKRARRPAPAGSARLTDAVGPTIRLWFVGSKL